MRRPPDRPPARPFVRQFFWGLATMILVLAAAVGLSRAATATQIAADLSEHEIVITAGFDGAELLLFGHDDAAGEVIVIVRGPDAPIAVRKKERVAGVWVNQEEVAFDAAPGFYFVGVTDGLRSAGALDKVLSETGLGAQFLSLGAGTAGKDPAVVDEFRKALIELNARRQLYAATPGLIRMRADGLFRTSVPFPAATPVGAYTVTVYHISDGWPVSATTTPLMVRKSGFGAFVYNVAHDLPLLYGAIAILVAAGAGWLAGWAFRRG